VAWGGPIVAFLTIMWTGPTAERRKEKKSEWDFVREEDKRRKRKCKGGSSLRIARAVQTGENKIQESSGKTERDFLHRKNKREGKREKYVNLQVSYPGGFMAGIKPE